uniref:Small ribosomal subunit protein bS18c n=1 Tax=Trentepohlia odorata TaxID=2576626 RepID=A0A4Y5P3I1_9CHLO|nr:ribosomal protein S18 [Trentepohlia odorata]QCW57817.1 ribosomal protein S18 [Trentepohlia odorata]
MQTTTSKYKNVKLLKKYLSISGKILPRKITKLTRKDQRTLKKAIKTARILGLLPFLNR